MSYHYLALYYSSIEGCTRVCLFSLSLFFSVLLSLFSIYSKLVQSRLLYIACPYCTYLFMSASLFDDSSDIVCQLTWITRLQ